jgi:hypothetical protein
LVAEGEGEADMEAVGEALGVEEADSDGEVVGVDDGESDAEGETEGEEVLDGEEDNDADGDSDTEGDAVDVPDGVEDSEAVGDGLGDAVELGDWHVPSVVVTTTLSTPSAPCTRLHPSADLIVTLTEDAVCATSRSSTRRVSSPEPSGWPAGFTGAPHPSPR